MEHTELVIFTICGQEFRIRTDRAEAKRTKRIADTVAKRIQKHRSAASNSDLRSALMAAIELAYELDESQVILESAQDRDKTIETAKSRMDSLLTRLEKELAVRGDAESASDAKGAKKHKVKQMDLIEKE